MKNNKIENPLEKIEEQMERILFANTNIELKKENIDKSFEIKTSPNSNINNFKKHLIILMKELKAKSIYLVA